MPHLRRVTHMCSRSVSDSANRLRKTRKKKSSAVPLFRSGRRSPIFAGLSSKGKVGVQIGRKTAGCPSFLPPPRGAARSRRPQTANPPAEVQRKTPCPERANTPAAVRAPRLSGAGKRAAPSGANTLTQFACPSQSLPRNFEIQKRLRICSRAFLYAISAQINRLPLPSAPQPYRYSPT